MSQEHGSTRHIHWVTPLMGIGGSVSPQALPHLADTLAVRHVVDCRREKSDDPALLAAHGLSLLHLPMPNLGTLLPSLLQEGVAWVAARLEREERVYIHCEFGIGRSALLTLCVLVHQGAAPLEALTRLKAARPIVSPSTSQLRTFLAWCHDWRTARGARWRIPSLEALEQLLGPLG